MNTTVSSSIPGTAPRSQIRRPATIGALAATVVNAALWAGGRAADVDFRVTPVGADEAMTVGFAMVILTTLVMFAIGAGLLALAARRSRQWVRAVVVAGALLAVVSAVAPPTTAEETATGVLLAAMHLVTGAAFVATATRVNAR